jgi:TRAP-type C4-dicarboxylate transport system permease small subunit
MTICALTHELGESVAVDLLMKILAPTILKGAEKFWMLCMASFGKTMCYSGFSTKVSLAGFQVDF